MYLRGDWQNLIISRTLFFCQTQIDLDLLHMRLPDNEAYNGIFEGVWGPRRNILRTVDYYKFYLSRWCPYN